MSDCTEETIETENIEPCINKEVMAGVSETGVYFSPVDDFEEIKELPALNAATSLSQAGTIADTHTFPAFTPPAAGKGFFKVRVLPDTGDVEGAGVGEKGARSNTNSFTGTLKGTGAENVGFIRKYQNVPMIIIVTDRNGEKHQIGSKINPAYMIENSSALGKKAGDGNNMPIKFEAAASSPAPIYAGTITEFTPATA